MKRTMMSTAAVSVFVLCIAAFAGAQDYTDMIKNEKLVAEAANYMLSQGQMISSAKNIDRPWLTDQGNQMADKAQGYTDAGLMIPRGAMSADMQEIGRLLKETGLAFVKMGTQQGPLAQKEQKEISRLAGDMTGQARMMLGKYQK